MTESKSNLKYSDDENEEDYNSSEDNFVNSKKNISTISLDENILQKKLRSMDIRMDNVIYYIFLSIHYIKI